MTVNRQLPEKEMKTMFIKQHNVYFQKNWVWEWEAECKKMKQPQANAFLPFYNWAFFVSSIICKQ